MMKEEAIRKLAEDYIDSCTKKSGFVILAESLKGDFIDLFVAGFMKCLEINKANEWHFVKDGDLPPFDTNVLVIHKWNRTPEVGKRTTVFINSSQWVWAMCSDRYRYTSDDKNVIAWKEIVLPEQEW